MTDPRIDLPPVSAALVANGVTEWATIAGRPDVTLKGQNDPTENGDYVVGGDGRWTPLLHPSPGERVAIWATDEEPNGWGAIVLNSGPYIPLRPAELHAHATVAEVLPIVDGWAHRPEPPFVYVTAETLSIGDRDISDQLPYCDWTPGTPEKPRQAVRFTDIEETP